MFKKNFTQTQINSISKFSELVEKGEISFQDRVCLCGHSYSHLISKTDRFGFPQRTVVCKKCGLVRSNPCLTDDSYRLFYSSDMYRMIYQNENYFEMANERLNNDYGKYLFETLSPMIKEHKNLNIIEFGCGGGWNLIHFHKAGYKVVGYDYSLNLTQIGRSFGLDLREGTISDIEGKYDIIILNHVIEHFTDLIGSIEAIVKHLKPMGLIYIGVPNIDNYSWNQLQNAHVYYFTPRTFKFFMSRCGLRNIKFGHQQKIHMYGIFEPDAGISKAFTLQSEPKRIIKKIRKTQIKETIGLFFQKIGIKDFIKSVIRKITFKK